MDTLEIRQLTLDDESAFLAGLEEWEGDDLTWHSFAWKEGMTCGAGNIPSTKMIEGAGGVFEREFFDDVENEVIRIYWIDLVEESD